MYSNFCDYVLVLPRIWFHSKAFENLSEFLKLESISVITVSKSNQRLRSSNFRTLKREKEHAKKFIQIHSAVIIWLPWIYSLLSILFSLSFSPMFTSEVIPWKLLFRSVFILAKKCLFFVICINRTLLP